MSENDIAIRALQHDDWADWKQLWSGYLTFYETTLAAEIHASTFERLLSNAAGEFNGLLACRDNQPVGLVHYLSHRHCWRLENVIYLQDLFVAQSERGQGIGRALIEAVYAEADQTGMPTVYWITQSDNHTARQLYDRIAKNTGFIKYQR